MASSIAWITSSSQLLTPRAVMYCGCRSWAVKANVVHYSWASMLINQYEHAPKSSLGGVNILSYFSLADKDPWAYLGVVVGFFFGWSVLAWLALAYARSHKR